MTDAQALAAALLSVEGAAVAVEGETVTVTRTLDSDDTVSLAGVCRTVYEHGGEVRDVRVAPDHREVAIEARAGGVE